MLIVTEAANLRQVLGGNSICQETHTHTRTAEQTESVPFVHLPTTDSWCGSANAPWSVAITDPIAAIPFPWPVSAQSWAWDVWCGAWAKSGLCPQQHAKITPFFFFNFREKTEGKDNTGSTQNSERKTPSAFWYWALGHEFFPVAAIQGIFH